MTKLDTAALKNWSGGFGVSNKDQSFSLGDNGDPYEDSSSSTYGYGHAMDNLNRKDSIQLSFDSAVALQELSIGWWSNDADVTVLALKSGVSATSLAGKTYAELVKSDDSGEWVFVGHYAKPDSIPEGSPFTQNLNNTANISSRIWLIGAYNTDVRSGSLDLLPDKVKLAGAKGDVPGGGQGGSVPEPGSLALLALGLVLLRRHVAMQ